MKLSNIETRFGRRAIICCTVPFITIFLLCYSLFEGIGFACIAFKDYMSEFKANIIREWSE